MVTIQMCNVLKGCLGCLWNYLEEPMELFVMRVGISSSFGLLSYHDLTLAVKKHLNPIPNLLF